MKLLPLCFILSLTLTLGICGSFKLPKTSIPSGIYITTMLDNLDTFTALQKLKSYCAGGNSLKWHISYGDLIVQGEKRCPAIGELKWKYVYSMPLYHIDVNNLPLPEDDSVYLDFHLDTKRAVYEKTFTEPISVDQVYETLVEFNDKSMKTTQKNWFYMTGFESLNTTPTFSKLWFDKAPRYRRSSCAPDDSNLQKLCSKSSSYKCPNTTYCMEDGIETRKMSMYIVTGEAKDYAEQNCSSGAAVMDQYMNNHWYFMGRNKKNLTMKRTIPVMTKITANTDQSVCDYKYQMQFFVKENPAPCPNNKNVLLKKLTNMEVYVKVFNGNANSNMNFLYQQFSKELTSQQRSYVAGQYYITAFRGFGPAFGHRIEIWILKNPIECSTQMCN